MVPYLITFSIVLILTYYAEKLIKSNKKKLGFILIVISIFILSFIAGVRNDNVGKDIGIYVTPVFKWAQNYSFFEYMKIGELEKGYMIFVYFITSVFNDYHVVLFLMQTIISTAVYIYTYKHKEKISMLLAILVYLLIFFNDTLTMMRQSIACAFILMSILQLKEKKYLSTGILYLLASSFHITSIVSLLIYFIIILDDTKKIKLKNKKKIYIFLFLCILIGIFTYGEIIYLLTYKIPILPNKFYEYFSSIYYNTNSLSISKSLLIFKSLSILTVAYIGSKKKNKEARTCFKLLCIDMCIYVMSFKLPPIMRLGQYFTYPALLLTMPQIKDFFKKDRNKRIIIRTLYVAFLVFFWCFTNVIHCENGRTYPYESKIIKNIFTME